MIFDDLLEFCDAQALNTGAAGTYNLGSSVDIAQVRDVGNGQPLYLVVLCSTGITVASSTGTVTFQLVTDTSAISTTTQVVLAASKPWATSTSAIAAGTVLFCVALPTEGAVYERLIGVQQVTGTTAINAGAVNAFLTTDVAKWVAYPDAL